MSVSCLWANETHRVASSEENLSFAGDLGAPVVESATGVLTAELYLKLLTGEWEGYAQIYDDAGNLLSKLFILQTYEWAGNTLECTTVFEEKGKTHISREVISLSRSGLIRKVYTQDKIVYYRGTLEGGSVLWKSEEPSIQRETRETILPKDQTLHLEMKGFQIAQIGEQTMRLNLATSLVKANLNP